MDPIYLKKYSKYKTKYASLKMDIRDTHKGGSRNKRRGLMIQAPMGSGKSYFMKNMAKLYPDDLPNIVDGDVLLDQHGIKNRNYFWYTPDKKAERKAILDVFAKTLESGVSILYSGSPTYIKTDILVVPDRNVRWKRLQGRDDFKPTREQFDREQNTYDDARSKIPIVFNSDIPPYPIIRAILDQQSQVSQDSQVSRDAV